jgi:hypothetical protein
MGKGRFKKWALIHSVALVFAMVGVSFILMGFYVDTRESVSPATIGIVGEIILFAAALPLCERHVVNKRGRKRD